MNFGIFDLLSLGAVAIFLALLVLLAMVHLELGVPGRLAGSGRWLLTGALGMGVLAFAFKLMVIVTVANLPQVVITPLIAGHEQPRMREPRDDRAVPWLGMSPAQQRYVWEALPERAPAPDDNPTMAAKVALGERLFFDPALSRDGTVACSSCHDVHGGAGGDGRPTSIGIDGQVGARNAPTVWNAAFQAVLFWDGRAGSLEEQAKEPLVNPAEMGMLSLAAVEQRVMQDPVYREDFARAFGAGVPITIDRIAAAIAAYERTLITPDAPYDRYVRGDMDALTPAQLRGMTLFQSVGCVNCHAGPNFSAASVFEGRAPFRPDSRAPFRIFPANATPFEARYELTGDSGAAPAGSSRGVWRVPSLRNVALTGPWLHNGSVTELAEVVRIMASAQLARSGRLVVWLDQDRVLNEADSPPLDEQDVNDIVAFLHALSSDSLAARIGKSGAQAKADVRYASN